MENSTYINELKNILCNNEDGLKYLKELIDELKKERNLIEQTLNEYKKLSKDYNNLYINHIELLKEYVILENNFKELDSRISNICGDYLEEAFNEIQ